MANIVEYDASAHNVHAITVFQVDRAEVNRRITVQLKEGQNEVVISHLPSCLDQNSIRVDGIGAATVFDVVYSAPSYNAPERDAEIARLNKKRAVLITDKHLLEQQVGILDDYSKSLNAKDADSAALTTFLTVYAERKRSLNEQLVALSEEIDAVAVAYNTAVSAHGQDTRGAKVTIVVLTEEDGEAELSLTYNVSNASWTPLYDLRANLADSGSKGSTNSVLLHYRASIAQSTGEDWEGVHLTLSTASPQLGSEIPTLKPQTVIEDVPLFKKSLPAGGSLFGASIARPAALVVQPTAAVALGQPASQSLFTGFSAPPPVLRTAVASVQESAVSATFHIDGLSTIPSDTPDAAQEHKVSISELTFSDVDLEWIAVPKVAPSAFVTCKIVNTSEYPLLPGQASVYMGNSFVARSSISNVAPGESFSASLGIDGAVRVTYPPQTRKAKTPAGGSLFSSGPKTATTSFTQRIAVKNARRTELRRLVVRDQVPISSDARIKVSLNEPREVDGARVRWALKNEDNPASGDAGDGRLEWILTVPAGESVDLTLAWDIIAPVGVLWHTQ